MAKKFLSILLVLVLVLGLLPAAGAAALSTSPTFSDMPDNWATEALESAVANGLLVGDDGKIMPDSPLTRAQMATIIARAFGATKEGDISEYADVKSTDWFAGSMAKAYKMGVMQDYAGKMEPNSNISREQAFVVLARALKLEPASVLSKSFEDEGEISDWAKGEVYALVNAGYIQGSNGKLNPKANISRAEFAQMMHNLIKQYIKAEGEYTEVANGNIMVNVPGVTLKNVTINGDLIVGDGVGDGNLTLDNVTIKGRLLARGGGVNSITIIGGSVEGKVIVAKVDGDIRVSVEGGADVEVIVIDDGKDDVIIEGTVGTVQITAAEVPVVIQNATVEKIEVVASGATNITVANGAAVTNVVVNSGAVGTTLNIEGKVNTVETSAANTAVSGTGTVSTVTAKEGADHTAVTTPNTKVNNEGASGVTAGGGKEVPENGSVINNSQGTDITTPPSGGGPSYVAISAISVEGDAVVGATLTAKVTPDKATVNYQWMRSESENEGYAPINDATDSTYELVAADVGKYIKVKATGTGNYKGTVESKPVGPVEPASEEPEVLEATWNDTGKVGTNTIDETAYVFQGFELLDSETNAQIALVASNIAKMTVLDPGAEEAKELEVGDDSDPLLWFNVRKAGGDYKYTVETKDGDVYEATLTWTAPVTATAEKTGEPAENEERKAIYQLYTVAVDVDPEDSKVYQIKPNGEISELAILTDSDNHLNIWFKVKDTANDDWKQLEGEHTFLIKKGDAWSEAVIEYKEPTQSEYGFEITGTDQDFVAGGLLEGTVIEGENGVNTEGLTPVEVTLKATTINELGYDNVKVLAPEVTGEGTLQFWAYSADDGLWFDAAVHGWGSGFPITADYNVTTPIYVFADTAGTYEVTFKLVEWSESGQVGEPITTITATITVISQEMANAINAAKNAIKPSWAVDRVEPVDDEALPSGVENVDYKVTIKTSYENKGEAQASGRTVTTLFTIPDGVTVWYPVWEDGKLTYISASSGEVALGMVGHPLNEENIDADGIVYVDLGETTETKFTVTIKLIDADEDWQGVVYGEQELEIEVPEVSEYGFEFEDNIEIIAGGLLDGYVYESEDGQSLGDLDVSDLTAVKVTLKATAEKDMGYKKVRILPLKVEGPDNSNLQAWMYDSEDKKWYDMVQTGWGSEGTGFKLDANENKEMTIYVFADTPGTYGLTFKAVDIKDGDKEITVGTATIFAPFHFDADTGTISNYVGNEENITIPATINGVTVKAIGAKTFNENTSIKTVTFAEGSQLEAIGDNAFKHCTNLESIDLPSTVKSIGSDAFLSCKLTTGIDISNVGSIGAWAFGGCKFTEITIPEGCNVGNYAFGYCGQLNKIIVGSGVSLGAYLVYYYEGDTDYGFMDAYTAGGEGTYVFEDGAWKKQ